jgi:hypothetical protein
VSKKTLRAFFFPPLTSCLQLFVLDRFRLLCFAWRFFSVFARSQLLLMLSLFTSEAQTLQITVEKKRGGA